MSDVIRFAALSGLCSLALAHAMHAQPYSPGFHIERDGVLRWHVLNGQIDEYLTPLYDERVDLPNLTENPTQGQIPYAYFTTLGGFKLVGTKPLELPGFGPERPWWYSIYGDTWLAPKQPAHWDTLYYTEEQDFCNGDYAIIPHTSFVHYNAHGGLDTLFHSRGNPPIETPIESFALLYTPSNRIDSVTTYFLLDDGGDHVDSYPISCMKFTYEHDTLLKRCVSQAAYHTTPFPVDSMIYGMRKVLEAHTIDAWNAFNTELNHRSSDRHIHQWIECYYHENRITEILVYSDAVSSIARFTWEYSGDRVHTFQNEQSAGLNQKITFEYHGLNQVKAMDIDAYYQLNGVVSESWRKRYEFLYDANNLLRGFR